MKILIEGFGSINRFINFICNDTLDIISVILFAICLTTILDLFLQIGKQLSIP